VAGAAASRGARGARVLDRPRRPEGAADLHRGDRRRRRFRGDVVGSVTAVALNSNRHRIAVRRKAVRWAWDPSSAGRSNRPGSTGSIFMVIFSLVSTSAIGPLGPASFLDPPTRWSDERRGGR
jgi:hypothetical protein